MYRILCKKSVDSPAQFTNYVSSDLGEIALRVKALNVMYGWDKFSIFSYTTKAHYTKR